MGKKPGENKSIKTVRVFSEDVRRQVVKDIEQGKYSVREITRELSVSTTTVYRWLNKYSKFLKSGKRIVVEHKSEASKSKKLEQQNQELLAIIGRMQIEKEFAERIIKEAGDHYGIDLKKSFAAGRWTGSERTKE